MRKEREWRELKGMWSLFEEEYEKEIKPNLKRRYAVRERERDVEDLR